MNALKLFVNLVLAFLCAALVVAMALCVIVWLTKPAHGAEATPWTRDDNIRQGLVIGLFLVDWRQTQHIVKNPGHYKEQNIILGEHPSMRRLNIYWATLIPLHTWVMTKLDRPTRTMAQRVFIGAESFATYRNHKTFSDHERDGHTHFSIGLRFPI